MCFKEIVRSRKIDALREKDYRSVYADSDGRIVIEVHEERFAGPELFRRVWGPEWPIVRSERWRNPKTTPEEKQFQFRSREY